MENGLIGEGQEMGSGLPLSFVGAVVYGLTSGLVTAIVLLDYLRNFSVYTDTYLMGALPFIVFNLLVTIVFTRAALHGDYKWPIMIAPVISYILISWLLHGISPISRTVLLSAMVFLGIVMVWISWRTQAES
jgi:hypothetical protein